MLMIRRDWPIGLSSPQKALEWVNSYIAYGRPAEAHEFLKQAIQKFPSDPGLQTALNRIHKLNHEEIAARNGPSLLVTLFIGAFLLWCCAFTIRGILEAPWTVKIVCVILLALCLIGVYAVARHAISRWRLKAP
jgi:hypothetical protein